jgi:hypothetical protein
MNSSNLENIKILHESLANDTDIVDYCGISNQNDFTNYESILKFKYKIVNTKYQLSKICEFITQYKHELDYDWYIKFRPDIKLLESINFGILSINAINARARVYRGPKRIKYGSSIGGNGCYKNVKDCIKDDIETNIVLDDQLFIFHHNIITQGGFSVFDPSNVKEWFNVSGTYYMYEHEWAHSNCWKSRNISLNIIGLNVCFTKVGAYSGDVNL